MTLKTHSIELNSMDNNHLSSLLPRTSNAGPSPIAAMTPSLRVANERRSPYGMQISSDFFVVLLTEKKKLS